MRVFFSRDFSSSSLLPPPPPFPHLESLINGDHATGPRSITELRSTPLKSIGAPSFAPANVVAVSASGSAGARLTFETTAAGVSCAGGTIEDCPTATAVVVATDGVDPIGNTIDDAPATEVVVSAAVEVVTSVDDSTDDEVVSGAADVTGVLESTTAEDELGVTSSAASDVLEMTATELDDETSIALDVLESTTVARDVGCEFTKDTEDACEGCATAAAQIQCQLTTAS